MTIVRATLILMLISTTVLAAPPVIPPLQLTLPGGEGGIGFHDLVFSPSLRLVLVPRGPDRQAHARVEPGFVATASTSRSLRSGPCRTVVV